MHLTNLSSLLKTHVTTKSTGGINEYEAIADIESFTVNISLSAVRSLADKRFPLVMLCRFFLAFLIQ